VGFLKRTDAVGKPFELAFTDAAISGKADFGEGPPRKVVLLDFWATWCGPCVAEMPKYKKLYAEFHSKGLEILGISLDRSENLGGLRALKELCGSKRDSVAAVLPRQAVERRVLSVLGDRRYPCAFLIDKNGNFAEFTDSEGIEAKVRNLLAG